jgi:hypothetical protein
MLLKQKGITHVIVVGLLANTRIESTARYAMELGYDVTLVRDATAAFTHETMHAAHELNGPPTPTPSAQPTRLWRLSRQPLMPRRRSNDDGFEEGHRNRRDATKSGEYRS